MRGVAVGCKHWLFSGSAGVGRAAAIAHTPIETTKLSSVDPQTWLTDTLDRMTELEIDGIAISRPCVTLSSAARS